MRRLLAFLPALLVGLAALLAEGADEMAASIDPATRKGERRADPGCISCHGGLEVMHPWKPLSCTECHGGKGDAKDKEKAHVRPKRMPPNDERTVPLNYDLEYRRFVNPSDMRVLKKTCAECHAEECASLEKSLHGTTAGHLSDGLYENGILRKRTDRYAIFPVKDEDGDVPEHAYASLPGLPAAAVGDGGSIGDHFSDLPRKSCMQCHLYSRGVGLRGRLGQDGWYRAEGCASCHVLYDRDGLSRSKDPTVDKLEPGHPRVHRMTSKIPTSTCTTCHALDANIGMSFRGLGQLPPGVPGGPDVKGTTDVLEKGRFFLNDPAICPPDVHHERGMHCIDCHGATDVMGDGNIWGFMEHAVAVRCESCHGTFDKKADFRNGRGEKLGHLRWEGTQAVLKSRVTGKDHAVKQVVDVLEAGHKSFNPKAKAAMTGDHKNLTCYACHSGWSVNFFGFHFDRNESFDQLDILSGRRTPGRVSTQEKMFATFRHYYLGWNSEGKIAPYMVGFSTAGTYRDNKGQVRLRQEVPTTAAGLSGLTLIHHQLHTVRPAARSCHECHANPSALGMGSLNFHLFRDLFVAVGDAGLTVSAIDAKNPAQSKVLTNLPLPARPVDVAVLNDPISGRLRVAYVALADGTMRIVDLRRPIQPRLQGMVRIPGIRKLLVRDSNLFVAAGREGVFLYSIRNPQKPEMLSRVQTFDAQGLFVDGLYLYVADGAGGMRIVDVSVPTKPATAAVVDLNGPDRAPLAARDVLVFYTAGRPDVAKKRRTPSGNIAYVADSRSGVYLVNVTDPRKPQPLPPTLARGGFSAMALAFASNYDIGSEGGQIPSAERDYLYVVGTNVGNGNGVILKLDVSNPVRPAGVGFRRTVDDPRDVQIARVFEAPFLKQYAVVAGRGRGNVELVDVTGRGQLPQAGVLEAAGPSVAVDIEAIFLDRLVDFNGSPLKDISHEGSRFFRRDEIGRILAVEVR